MDITEKKIAVNQKDRMYFYLTGEEEKHQINESLAMIENTVVYVQRGEKIV